MGYAGELHRGVAGVGPWSRWAVVMEDQIRYIPSLGRQAGRVVGAAGPARSPFFGMNHRRVEAPGGLMVAAEG